MADYKHVVVLGIDGAGAYYQKTDTPNIDRIFKNGALTYKMRVTSPTSSAHSWCSCLHGCLTEHHGIVENYYVENNPFPRSAYHYPSFLKVIKENIPDGNVIAIGGWPGINGLIEEDSGVEVKRLFDTAATRYVVDECIPERQPTAIYVLYGSTDGTGHLHGYGSPEHLKQITYVDSLVGEIYDALEKAGMLDDTLFIVTSDHGGVNRANGTGTHGGLTDEEKYAILALAGKTVEAGEPSDVEIRDVASIVLYALGIQQPKTYSSHVPNGIFKGVSASVRPYYQDPTQSRYHLPMPTRDFRCFVDKKLSKPLICYSSFDDKADPFEVHADVKYVPGFFDKGIKLDDGYLTLDGVDFDRKSITICTFIKTGSPFMDAPIITNKPCQDFDEVSRDELINGFVINYMRNTYVVPPVHSARLELVSWGRPSLVEAALPADYQYGWMHLCVVIDRKDGRASFYFDFKLAATVSVPWLKIDDTLSGAGDRISIGQDTTENYPFKFGFSIDELAIFEGALSANEISALGRYYRGE